MLELLNFSKIGRKCQRFSYEFQIIRVKKQAGQVRFEHARPALTFRCGTAAHDSVSLQLAAPPSLVLVAN